MDDDDDDDDDESKLCRKSNKTTLLNQKPKWNRRRGHKNVVVVCEWYDVFQMQVIDGEWLHNKSMLMMWLWQSDDDDDDDDEALVMTMGVC